MKDNDFNSEMFPTWCYRIVKCRFIIGDQKSQFFFIVNENFFCKSKVMN